MLNNKAAIKTHNNKVKLKNITDNLEKIKNLYSADENELADKLEELEDNEGILDQLEKQLEDVNNALERIEKGNYGICEVSGEPIEKERLMANPAAKTCMKHINK